jgi:hypothetical protein
MVQFGEPEGRRQKLEQAKAEVSPRNTRPQDLRKHWLVPGAIERASLSSDLNPQMAQKDADYHKDQATRFSGTSGLCEFGSSAFSRTLRMCLNGGIS